jgi:hypothetical protein
VFTTAATATLIVLASDLGAWTQSAAELRRLGGVIVGLLAGAAAGAALLVHARSYAAVLPLVVTGVVIATAWVVFGTRTGLPAAPAHRTARPGGSVS